MHLFETRFVLRGACAATTHKGLLSFEVGVYRQVYALTMFWKFDLNTTSHVDKLLDKEEVTLSELMDEDDLLQECRAQNHKLVAFLCQQHCMEELIRLITCEPPLDMDEKVRFKYPNTACELLTSDVPQINDKLGGDETLLNNLCDFLDREPPLNPLLASFFSKTIGNLIARKTEQVISFLKTKAMFLDLVLKHMDTSAMMDLLLRLISCVEPAQLRQEVLNWLNEARITQRLVGLIHPTQAEERQANASQTLCDIIRLSRDQSSQLQEVAEPVPLLTVLESQECVEQLLKNMFDEEPTETCIVNGTRVLLTLLEQRRAGTEGLADSSSPGFEGSSTVGGSILSGIEPRLTDFHHLLLNPPKAASIRTTIGVLEEPLGNARLHGACLIAALLHTNTLSVNQELCRLNTMDLLLKNPCGEKREGEGTCQERSITPSFLSFQDLFFKYTWNNFLHFQVELCIAAIMAHSVNESRTITSDMESKEEMKGNAVLEEPLNRPENVMVTHLLQKCCLVQRILDAWETNDRIQAEGGMRRGYMGHLTRIANAVVQNMEKGPTQTQIGKFIQGLPADCRGRWESFVEETLTEANRRNTVDVVSSFQVRTAHLLSSSEDEDPEAAFPGELSLQQAFSEYQLQQVTATFGDQFGLGEEEFADQDDNINAPFDRIAEISFGPDADEDSPGLCLFEACSSERIQQFDDPEEDDDDIWEEKEVRRGAQVQSRARFGVSWPSEGSSKADLENGGCRSSQDSGEEGAGPSAAGVQGSDSFSELTGPESSSEGSVLEPVSSRLPAACAATDVGSSVWGSASPGLKDPEERGWATFTDFQPFCCSEAGPRCSSPMDPESSESEGHPKQSEHKMVSAAPSCVWNVCVARKAPLLASDSSSSGGSDSEEGGEDVEKVGMAMGPISTGSGQEPASLTLAATSEAAFFASVDQRPTQERRLAKPLITIAQPCDGLQGATATEVRRERKEELLPGEEATPKGPA
ncbi:hypothetical protein lerEdw1_020971 [Lerista edwardsae]|nr:hypothetical protein lerEdw1_020971 [Lerista edwardsae]